MKPEEALRLAKEKELDLVEIVPTAKPPVCRIMNYGKYLYQKNKARQFDLTSLVWFEPELLPPDARPSTWDQRLPRIMHQRLDATRIDFMNSPADLNWNWPPLRGSDTSKPVLPSRRCFTVSTGRPLFGVGNLFSCSYWPIVQMN